jgi:hypothetical protein
LPLQVFLSYATADDELPGRNAGGFVTKLKDYLDYFFKRDMATAPAIWRDEGQIKPSDQFDEKIKAGIEAADVLLVVLSRNWVVRPYCLAELDLFAQRWRHEGDKGIQRRIVVAAKNHLDPGARPALLQGQTAYLFYDRKADAEVGTEREFFRPSKTVKAFSDQVERIAIDLVGRSRGMPVEQPGPVAASPSSRTIYVAKPAEDMEQDYHRLVAELVQNRFVVVPDPQPAGDIPYKSSAVARSFIEAELAHAELSIHLLGEAHGYTPAGGSAIAPLQLELAGEHVGTNAPTPGAAPFRRIIWAPKVLIDASDPGRSIPGRVPHAVLKSFDRERDPDQINGSDFRAFVNDLIRHLDGKGPQEEAEPIEAGGRVYVFHHADDRAYAVEFARVLKQLDVQPTLPTRGGDLEDVERMHKMNLERCDAVVLCWATAADSWVRANTAEWKNWRMLGRSQNFSWRALVAGPPPFEDKSIEVEFSTPSEVGMVLDLMDAERPTVDLVAPLLNVTRTPSGESPPVP